MHPLESSKSFSVDIFNDGEPLDQSSWIRLGNFKSLDQAIAACKAVIDGYLTQRKHLIASPSLLAEDYLKYGSMPCIRCDKNLSKFDVYEYLDKKCFALYQ